MFSQVPFIMKIDSICRICLDEGTFEPLFDSYKTVENRKIMYIDMLVICAAVTVDKMDGLPNQICNNCLKKLWSAYKFRNLCEKSYLYLKNYIEDNKPLIKIKIEKQEIQTDSNLDNLCRNNDYESDDIDGSELESNVKCEEIESDHSDNIIFEESRSNKKLRFKKIKLRHKKEKSPGCGSSKEPTLKCLHCPKMFRFKHRLMAHEDSHIGIKRYFCQICQKAYRSEKDHKYMHSRGLNFKCDVCSRSFNTKAKLAQHLNTHQSAREKIICGMDGCAKEFTTQGGLKKHQSQHDGVKNFVCHLCSKKFIDKYALDIHLKRHNNDKRYQCSFCPKKFVQASPRAAHERRHTNTRNHQCSHCDKKFYTPATLRRHLVTHTKVLNEVCRFCAKRFGSRDNRKRHETVIHGVSKVGEKSEPELCKI